MGKAVQSSTVPRDQIWLTSKVHYCLIFFVAIMLTETIPLGQLWNNFHSPEDIEPVLDVTLANLGTNYLDLYLIHW